MHSIRNTLSEKESERHRKRMATEKFDWVRNSYVGSLTSLENRFFFLPWLLKARRNYNNIISNRTHFQTKTKMNNGNDNIFKCFNQSHDKILQHSSQFSGRAYAIHIVCALTFKCDRLNLLETWYQKAATTTAAKLILNKFYANICTTLS